MKIVGTIVMLVCQLTPVNMHEVLAECGSIEKNNQKSSVFVWRDVFKESPHLKIEVYFANQAYFYSRLFLFTGTN